jgi:hypothetical protein
MGQKAKPWGWRDAGEKKEQALSKIEGLVLFYRLRSHYDFKRFSAFPAALVGEANGRETNSSCICPRLSVCVCG